MYYSKVIFRIVTLFFFVLSLIYILPYPSLIITLHFVEWRFEEHGGCETSDHRRTK